MTGYLAFLDVLGFSALVREENNDRLERYGNSIADALGGSHMKSVVFSDSIVLTAEGAPDEALLKTVVHACSRLFFDSLASNIALRGAIAYGDFIRSAVGESVFVAGKALIDAYDWEQKQDWVGIMVAPSALKTVPTLSALCDQKAAEYKKDASWYAHLRYPYNGIPFHSNSQEINPYYGFAVVPCRTVLPAEVEADFSRTIEWLQWLKMMAPSTESQQKYERTIRWLGGVVSDWRQVVAAFPPDQPV